MKTPVCDFVDSYVKNESARLHMPGHKGVGGVNAYDITEVYGADVLAFPNGIIRESEENAAKLFGAAATLYSTEGSTASIKTMLALALLYARKKGKKQLVLAARNVHRAFVDAAALLDFGVEWLSGEGELISITVTAETLEKKLESLTEPPVAFYVTSPDYLGNVADIAGLSKVCKKYGVLLLVDNAHGAYLKFLKPDIHPITLGADMCADSAHKSLPCLTGGSYLHVNNAVNRVIGGDFGKMQALFNSTSPSWLVIYSLDKLNAVLFDGYTEKLSAFVTKIEELKRKLTSYGYTLVGNEPLKITLSCKNYGYTGEEIAAVLRKNSIEVEFFDDDYLVAMFSTENTDEQLKLTENALLSITRKSRITTLPPPSYIPKRAVSIREATFALSDELPVDRVIGRVFASSALSCPPAIPIITAGEVIDEEVLKAFKYYGVKNCRVTIKE